MGLQHAFFVRWEESLLPTARATASLAPAAGALIVWRTTSRRSGVAAKETRARCLPVAANAPAVRADVATDQPARSRQPPTEQASPRPLVAHVLGPSRSDGGHRLGTNGPVAVVTHPGAQPQPSTGSRGPAQSAGEAEDGDATGATVLADSGAGTRLAGHMSSEGAPIAVTAY